MLKRFVVWVLTTEARLIVRKYRPRIVAVTGSVGKTSTKDAIAQVLSATVTVRKSEKSFNSELGLPLTILGRPNAWHNPLGWLQNILDGALLLVFRVHYPEWLVLEVGADRPGDISSLASWLAVDVAVITRLPEIPVHVEFFSSPEAVVEEKASLINALKSNGTLVLYGDDDRTLALADRGRERDIPICTFGLSSNTDVWADAFSVRSDQAGNPVGMQAMVHSGGETAPLILEGTMGPHLFLSLLAAVAVGKTLGEDLSTMTQALHSYIAPRGRMHIVHGIKHSLLIDDTYNSSPAAVFAALDTLVFLKRELPAGRSIAVLGDMLELGRYSVGEHKKVGAYAARCVDLLLTVGFRARDIAQGALDAGFPESALFQYEDARVAGEELSTLLQEHDHVLIKGSQSMRMERTVETVMAYPEYAATELVRQEKEWKKR